MVRKKHADSSMMKNTFLFYFCPTNEKICPFCVYTTVFFVPREYISSKMNTNKNIFYNNQIRAFYLNEIKSNLIK